MMWEFVEEPRMVTPLCQVYRAETERDFEDVASLWSAVYGREFGWLSDAGTSPMRDAYDASSTYLVVSVEGSAAGTMRMVTDSSAGLPLEQFVSIADIRGDKRLVECQRLMILPEFRNQRWPDLPYGVFGGLVKSCIQWCVLTGVSHIIADLFLDTRTTPVEPLKAIGFTDTGKRFIDTELAEEGTSAAFIMPVGELMTRPFRTKAAFYRYLVEYDEAIDIYR